MYNNIDALLYDNEYLSSLYDDFCPQFPDADKAVEYAKCISNNNDYRKAEPICRTNSKGDIIVYGDIWTMAVIPIHVNGKWYYEVTKASYVGRNPQMPSTGYERINILPIFENFRGMELSDNERKRVSLMEVDTDGNIYRKGALIKQQTSHSFYNHPYFHNQINLEVHKIKSHRVSHIVWAAFNDISYDIVKIMTSHIGLFFPEYLQTSDLYQLNILELRNLGWQWSIDHINNDTSDNSFCNLQLCTLHANIKLRDIRNELRNYI